MTRTPFIRTIVLALSATMAFGVFLVLNKAWWGDLLGAGLGNHLSFGTLLR